MRRGRQSYSRAVSYQRNNLIQFHWHFLIHLGMSAENHFSTKMDFRRTKRGAMWKPGYRYLPNGTDAHTTSEDRRPCEHSSTGLQMFTEKEPPPAVTRRRMKGPTKAHSHFHLSSTAEPLRPRLAHPRHISIRAKYLRW